MCTRYTKHTHIMDTDSSLIPWQPVRSPASVWGLKGDAALGLPKPRLRRPAATTGRRAPEKPGPALGEREVSGEGEDFGECPAVVGDLGDPWRMALLNLLTEWKI